MSNIQSNSKRSERFVLLRADFPANSVHFYRAVLQRRFARTADLLRRTA